MGRPVRSFPCRSICYPPLPLAQHPQHAAEVLFSASTAHSFGSFESALTTLEAQHRTDQQQHTWNANSLPSTMNTAPPISDMIAPPGHLKTGLFSLGFPFGNVTNFDACRSSGSAKVHRHRFVSPRTELRGWSRLVYHLSSFPAVYPLMKFPGIGVALRALELLHLVSTFILRGRGLLNLLHLRSDYLSTSSPTRSSSLCPIETQNLHSTMTMHQAQQRTAAHCQLGNTTLQSLFSLDGFLGKRITTQATSASTSSSTIPTTTETSVNTNVTFPSSYFHLPPSLLGSVLL